jgi:predicted nucleotidyltransferase
VDLAVLVQDAPRTAPSSGAAFRLREPVCELLGTERVDLVDLRDAPPVLRFEILRTGRALYVADPEVQELFEMETIHLYRDTHFLRRQQREYLKEEFNLWFSDEKRSTSG